MCLTRRNKTPNKCASGNDNRPKSNQINNNINKDSNRECRKCRISNANEVSSNISGVSDAARHTGEAASQVLSAAGDLNKQSSTLETEVGQFIRSVQAL